MSNGTPFFGDYSPFKRWWVYTSDDGWMLYFRWRNSGYVVSYYDGRIDFGAIRL